MNPIVQAMQTAAIECWCVSTWCTTCGHKEFAEALVQTESPPQRTIESSLAEIDFAELQSAPNWRDCLQSIFQRRRGPGGLPILSSAERQRVLKRWSCRLLKSADLETRLTDFAMFYLVRNEPMTSEVISPWLDHSLPVLRATCDRSLAETLIYFARRHSQFRDDILKNVFEFVATDPLLESALEKLAMPEIRKPTVDYS